jgi:hypothetical protein
MIICPQHKLVYLAPPKTGSTAIVDLLLSRQFGGKKLGKPAMSHHDVVWQPRFKHWFSFVSVRNPYRRMISLWQFSVMRVNQTKRDKFTNFFSTIFNSDDHSFDAFMNSATVHNCSKSVWRCHWQQYKFSKPIDAVVYQERLNEDIKKIPGLSSVELKKVNTSCPLIKPWYEYYEPEHVDKVRSWFAIDFDKFSYNPNFDECVNGNYFANSLSCDSDC